MDSSLSEVL
uniref:Uncharacterized protein n=1 Tax=Anguilla anguilla TaxID=7936 RepID=A0A0E9VQ43_ANGAN